MSQASFGLDVAAWQPPLTGVGFWRRVRRTLAVMLGGLVLGAVLSVAYETGAYADKMTGRILPGAVVEGIDVGGMTPAEATAAVAAVVDPLLDREVQVAFGSSTWSTTPRQLGSTSDLADAMAAAAHAGRGTAWLDLVRMRWLDEELSFERDVVVRHDPDGVRAFVDEVAASVNRPPVDARLDTTDGWVRIVAAELGYVVDTAATSAALLEGLERGGDASLEVPLGVHGVAPAVTDAAYRQVLLVRQSEHKLYLYEDGKITHEWVVTTGTGRYPTPTGIFTIGAKRKLPSWGNPAPNGWGRGMPLTIGPGPGNPLGLRALNWNDAQGRDTAIRFHGTQAVNQLGRDGSHGCVRLSNPDVVELFDLVDSGATIVSVR